jgi:hypothetical protein
MKITFRKFFYLLAFISFTLGAKAQNTAVPDTTRISVGLDGSHPEGNFAGSYTFGIGASVQVDIPWTEKLYVTGSVGYMDYSPNSSGSSPEEIINVKLSNLELAPIKVGLKYFLIRTFYVQGEVGETLLLNKSAVYGLNSFGLTYAPQMGILFKLKHKNYIDGGVRFERAQSFYGDGGYNNFWGVRVAYAFNLK